MTVLESLITAIASKNVRVVDLTRVLNEDTPLLPLPARYKWGESWPFSKQ